MNKQGREARTLQRIACNATNSAAINSETGQLYVWGSAKHGLLGKGEGTQSQHCPKELPLEREQNHLNRQDMAQMRVLEVSMGLQHMVALCVVNTKEDTSNEKQMTAVYEDGLKTYVFAWGRNDERLGIGTVSKKWGDEEGEQECKKEVKVEGFVGPTVVKFDMNNQLNPLEDLPIGKQQSKERIVAVSCGRVSSLAMSSAGHLYSWGFGQTGALGQGKIDDQDYKCQEPKKIKVQTKQKQNKYNSNNNEENETEYAKSQEDIKFTQIACGGEHCLALDRNGNVHSWGSGQGGRLGHDQTLGKNVPNQIKAISKNRAIYIACGDANSACITRDADGQQDVWIWGVGLYGRNGIGTSDKEVLRPVAIADFSSGRFLVKSIYLGMTSSFVITDEGQVHCWGSGQYGKLGIEFSSTKIFENPKMISDLRYASPVQIAPGPFHTLVLDESGKIYAFGSAGEGKLGVAHPATRNKSNKMITVESTQDTSFVQQTTPEIVVDAKNKEVNFNQKNEIKTFSVQNNRLLKEQKDNFDSKNSVYTDVKTLNMRSLEAEYENRYAEKGRQMTNNMRKLQVVQVCCTAENSFFLLASGEVYATGNNTNSQCSNRGAEAKKLEQQQSKQSKHESMENTLKQTAVPESAIMLIKKLEKVGEVTSPARVELKENVEVIHLSVGQGGHVLAIDRKANCWSWGNNDCGQLALGASDSIVHMPCQITDLMGVPLKMTACGKQHSLFLTKTGKVWSCGKNQFGQLGYDTEEKRHIDTKMQKSVLQINDLKDVTFIAAGEKHSLAVQQKEKNPLKLYSWGWNGYGQLGRTNENQSFTLNRPKKVETTGEQKPQFVMVSAGARHTLAIDMENQLWFCGDREAIGDQGDLQHRHQYEMMQVMSRDKGISSEDLIFVTASHKNNYVLNQKNEALAFGQSSYPLKLLNSYLKNINEGTAVKGKNEGGEFAEGKKKVGSGGLKVQVDLQKVPSLYTRHMAAGPSHQIAISCRFTTSLQDSTNVAEKKQQKKGEQKEKTKTLLQYVPMAWGNVTGGRCGIQIEGGEEGAVKKDTHIAVPTIFDPFRKNLTEEVIMMLKNQRVTKMLRLETRTSQQQPATIDDIQTNSAAQLQEKLVMQKREGTLQTGESLKKQDDSIIEEFHGYCQEYNTLLLKFQKTQQEQVVDTQNGLITRIHNFPTLIDTYDKSDEHQATKSYLPMYLQMNFGQCKKIFSFLQMHPCYIICWLVGSKDTTAGEFERMIRAVYGQTLKDNLRLIVQIAIIMLSYLKFKVLANEMPFEEFYESSIQDLSEKDDQPLTLTWMINWLFDLESQNEMFLNYLIVEYIRDTGSKAANQQYHKCTKMVLYEILKSKLEEDKLRNLQKFVNYQPVSSEANANGLQNSLSHLWTSFISETRELIKQQDPRKLIQKNVGYSRSVIRFIIQKKIEKILKLSRQALVYDILCLDDNPPACPDKRELKAMQENASKFLNDCKQKNAEEEENFFSQDQCTELCNNLELDENNTQRVHFSLELTNQVIVNSAEECKPVLSIKLSELQWVIKEFAETCFVGENKMLMRMGSKMKSRVMENAANKSIAGKQGTQITSNSSLKEMCMSLAEQVEQKKRSRDRDHLMVNIPIDSRLILSSGNLSKCAACFAPMTPSLEAQAKIDFVLGKGDDIVFPIKVPHSGYQMQSWRSDSVFERYEADSQYNKVGDLSVEEFTDILLILPPVDQQPVKDAVDLKILRIDQIRRDNKAKFVEKISTMDKKTQLQKNEIQKQIMKPDVKQVEEEKARVKLENFKQGLTAEVRQEYARQKRQEHSAQNSKMQGDAESKKDNEACLSEKIIKRLRKKVNEQNMSLGNHQQLVHRYTLTINLVNQQMEKLEQRRSELQANLANIRKNTQHGLASEFLRTWVQQGRGNQQKAILAGTLGSKDYDAVTTKQVIDQFQEMKEEDQSKLLDKAMKGKQNYKTSENQRIQEFFGELEYRSKSRHSSRSKRQAVFGNFKYNDLLKDGVIEKQEKISTKLKRDETILNQTVLVFNDNGQGGFKIDSIYKQTPKLTITCIQKEPKEAVLSSFEISRANIINLRESLFKEDKAVKNQIKFGEYTFNRFKLNLILNELISHTFVYDK